MPKTLEVCVDSFESAMAAITGGANRLELCSSLPDGGLTPTPGLLMMIQNANATKIPVFCMLRCRPGNFTYTPEEVEIMKEDAKVLRKYGADGFVFGALLPNGDVDMKNSREIIKTCFPLPVTFHRAFDLCRRPTIEIEATAQLGVKMIKKLMEQVGNRIVIVPGSGITVDNLKYVIENTDATEFHGSFRKVKSDDKKDDEAKDEEAAAGGKGEVRMGDRDGPVYVTDEQLVAHVVEILRSC